MRGNRPGTLTDEGNARIVKRARRRHRDLVVEAAPWPGAYTFSGTEHGTRCMDSEQSALIDCPTKRTGLSPYSAGPGSEAVVQLVNPGGDVRTKVSSRQLFRILLTIVPTRNGASP
jgi:hypothetical protein